MSKESRGCPPACSQAECLVRMYLSNMPSSITDMIPNRLQVRYIVNTHKLSCIVISDHSVGPCIDYQPCIQIATSGAVTGAVIPRPRGGRPIGALLRKELRSLHLPVVGCFNITSLTRRISMACRLIANLFPSALSASSLIFSAGRAGFGGCLAREPSLARETPPQRHRTNPRCALRAAMQTPARH